MVITQPGASYNLKPGWYDGGNGKGSRSGLQVRYRDGHQGDPRAKGDNQGWSGRVEWPLTTMGTLGEKQVQGRVRSSGLDTPGLALSWSGQLGSPESPGIQVLR